MNNLPSTDHPSFSIDGDTTDPSTEAAVAEMNTDATADALLPQYVGLLSYIERLHRLLLDVVKDEFERLQVLDVTSVQALLLFNIGDNEVTAGELKTRRYYQGSNVTYNLKKLIEGGYISSERCSIDRRSVRINITDEGRKIRQIVGDLWARHTEIISDGKYLQSSDVEQMHQSMQSLERFWVERIRYIY